MGTMDLAAVSRAVATALRGVCAVPRGTPVAVACSGGADSVALVHALAAVADADATVHGPPTRPGDASPLAAVLFVDHGLRDVSAERAAAAAAAAATGVPFRSVRLAPLGPGNLQANARAARYRALLSLAPQGALVATGHTADDQTETLLGRMARGTGLPGLRGIRPRDGRLVRPLLAVPRAVTRALGLPFSDDPSNDTPRFLRNRLRATVIPALLEENPRLHEAFAALSEAAEGTGALLDALLPPVSPAVPSPPLDLPLAALGPSGLAALLRQLAGRLAPDVPPSHAALTALSLALSTRPEAPAGGSLGNGWAASWAPEVDLAPADVRFSGVLRFEPERDLRVITSLHGPGTTVAHGHLLTVLDAGAAAGLSARRLPAATLWPLRAACEAGALVVRDAAGEKVWPEGGAVPTCSGPGAVPVAADGGPLALRVARAWPLTVVARGFLRVTSADSTPRPRSGRSS
jgi:tRNA(Ile)-lysidine synthase